MENIEQYEHLLGSKIAIRYIKIISGKTFLNLSKITKISVSSLYKANVGKFSLSKSNRRKMLKYIEKENISILTFTLTTLINTALNNYSSWNYTHSLRVCEICRLIFNNLPKPLKLKVTLKNLMVAGVMHDIGKIFISTKILNKNGKLDTKEKQKMDKHPANSNIVVDKIVQNNPDISKIVIQHHEKVNGKGYPKKLFQDKLLLESQILSVADVFEALTAERPYKQPKTIEEALLIMDNENQGLNQDIVSVLRKLYNRGYFSKKKKYNTFTKV